MSFRLVFLGTVSLLVFYTGLCLNRMAPGHPVAVTFVTAAIPVFIIGVQILIRKGMMGSEPFPGRTLVWAGSLGLGYWASFTLFFALADLCYLTLLLAGIFSPDSTAWALYLYDSMPSVARVIALVAFAAMLAGFLETLWGPRVKKVQVAVPGLPAALAGLTIAQISDLHIGPTIHHSYIARVVSRTLALHADIIAVTGDIADGLPQDLRLHSAPLASLTAPLGIYYITGNHEYYSGALAWIAEAERLGFIPLINENRIVTWHGETVLIAGVTDLGAHHFIAEHRSDPARAIAGGEGCAFKLLLAHQPESCFNAAPAGFHLQLSGHTHGGQFFPFSLLVRLFKRYSKGHYRHEGMAVYVNAGTGFWGVASRLFVPAEITLLTIVAT